MIAVTNIDASRSTIMHICLIKCSHLLIVCHIIFKLIRNLLTLTLEVVVEPNSIKVYFSDNLCHDTDTNQ
jgi:hypothetical protein